jgi:hypothetical protein
MQANEDIMEQAILKNYHFIQKLAHESIDKRNGQFQALKAANRVCRTYIENKLSQNLDLQKIISLNTEASLLLKDLIVDNTLLKMNHLAVLWEINAYTPCLLTKAEQALLNEFSSYCDKALEVMKKDEVLIQIALKADFREFTREFNKTIYAIIVENIKNNIPLKDFYNSAHHKACLEKIKEYALKFFEICQR